MRHRRKQTDETPRKETQMIMKLKVRKLGKYWWITGDEECGLIGPFDTRKEAEEDRKSIIRTMKNIDTPGYWTTQSPT
jgi:hypothetical protein